MANKDSLLTALKECSAIVEGEIATLTKWEIAPGTTTGRAAECSIARRFLAIGQTSSAAIMARIIADAQGLALEAVRAFPSASSLALIASLHTDFKARQALPANAYPPGPTGQLHFELVVEMSKDNAQHTVDCAAAIYAECTA